MELPKLYRCTLNRRYKRFLADISFEDGSQATAHCANTGAMTGCWEPGAPAEVSYSENPKRKLKWSLERVEMDGSWVGVNTSRTNAIIAEGIRQGSISGLSRDKELKREPAVPVEGFGKSRLDILLTGSKEPDIYIEVKNATLLGKDNRTILFPDAVTERGKKHLEILQGIVQMGHRGVLLFALNHQRGEAFAPASHIDPAYCEQLTTARASGVEVLVAMLKHSPSGISVGANWGWESEAGPSSRKRRSLQNCEEQGRTQRLVK